MSDEQALLAAVWNQPHDDTPRLVYADWLEESGAPANVARAEFIRAQCELARIDDDDPPRVGVEPQTSQGLPPVECKAASPRRLELEAREQQLLKKHAKAWKAGLPAAVRTAPYRRGFLAPPLKVLSARKLLGMTEADVAPAPLWDFALPVSKADFPKAVRSPVFARIGRLELRPPDSGYPAGFLAVLAGAPAARNVARLVCPGGNGGDADLIALAESPHLSSLSVLLLRYQQFTPAGVRRAFGRRERPVGLRGLYLMHSGLDSAAVADIAASPWCAGLRELGLSENAGVTDDGVLEVVRAQTLWYLDLNNLPAVTDKVAAAIAGSPRSAELRALMLNRTAITDQGAAALATSPHLGRLRWLTLFDTKVKKAGPAAKALRERFGDAVRV